MTGRRRGALVVLVLLALLVAVAPAHAGVSPLWQELDGSASGDGISGTPAPRALLDVSVAVGGDGHPVVVYAESPDGEATEGAIVVRAWNGSAWVTLSPAGGLGPGSVPQVRISPAGAIYVAWLHEVGGSPELRLRVRRADGSTFEALGGSDSAGGVATPGVAAPFALAVGDAERPTVAFLAPALTGITAVGAAPAVVAGTLQAYVRRWSGAAWEFVGSDRGGDGASGAVSFGTAAGSILHSVGPPALALDAADEPAVAFAYLTEIDGVAVGNSDVYVTRWSGAAWEAVGPAVPAADSAAGRGGAGGVSASEGASLRPSLAAAPGGRLALAWEEHPAGGGQHVWLRVWNGAEAWEELGGSATGGGLVTPGTLNGIPQVGVGPDGQPIVAWNAASVPGKQIFVRRWNGSAWQEIGLHSASGPGVSAAAWEAFAPALALTPEGGTATAGEPAIAWLDARDPASAQAFLRRLFAGPVVGLSVSVLGDGTVSGDPIALECAGDLCSGEVPPGTPVTLTATPQAGGAFTGWGGACAFRGISQRCTLTLEANTSVTAAFKLRRVKVAVGKPAGTVGQGALGRVTGPDIDCGIAGAGVCAADISQGTRVLLVATPEAGNRFVGWVGGACDGRTNASCQFRVLANTSTTALFRGVTRVQVARDGNGGGTITGPGIGCGADCAQDVATGARVTLTPTAVPGSVFRGWSGDVCDGQASGPCVFVASGTDRSITVVGQSVTGRFELTRHRLTVLPRPGGRVDSGALPGGLAIDCGAAGPVCEGTLDHGTAVLLRATPDPGFAFVRWTGVACEPGGASNASCAFVLGANTTATPSYRAVSHVSLVKTGQGVVTSLPDGLRCGLACAAREVDFARDVRVKLTAAPQLGWDFIGWSGDAGCAGLAPCVFDASRDRIDVAAAFTIQMKTLRVTIVGDGSVTGAGFTCPGTTCAPAFAYGTAEALTPVAAPGFRFTGWSQACTGTAACKPPMTVDRSVTATFRPVFGVTVARQGDSPNSGSLSAPGITCGKDCAQDYLGGTSVTFTRSLPPAGRTFRWLGDCAFRGKNESCRLTFDANKSVIGDYSLQRLGLTVKVKGPGSVAGVGDPCAAECPSVLTYGSVVKLQAVPSSAPEGEFVSWTGCNAVSGANCSVTLTANRTVVATFRPAVTAIQVTAIGVPDGTPLAVKARRQYSAVATFSDDSTQDVTTRAAWTSSDPSVVTVLATTGLATGVGVGNTSLKATFRKKVGTLAVTSDTVSSVGVACEPYGESGGRLSCLPAGVAFEVECRATGTFAHTPGAHDVTDQAVWSSTSKSVARPLGLAQFGAGPIVASFRIFPGTAAIRATVSGVGSPGTVALGNGFTVQGVALGVTGVGVATPPGPTSVGTPVQLQALASFAAAGACPVRQHDVSLATTWRTSDPSVAEVTFFGLVDPLAPGAAGIHWTYPLTGAKGDVPLTVVP